MRKEKLKKVLTQSMLKIALRKPDAQHRAMLLILKKRKQDLDETNKTETN